MNARMGDELNCLVCSDKAMGNNFGAISCESCKAFFRRNAHDIEKLRCEFTGKCSITTLTRRHCRRCRLEKCFQVGMRKDWILTEEQLQIRRARIQSRKSRELVTRSNVNPMVSSSSSCTNTEQLSSAISSTSPRDQHFAHHHAHQLNHPSTFNVPMSFRLDSGLSTLHGGSIGFDQEEDDEDEESDNDYAEICDKMGRKFFDNSYSHNMLTTLLDNNSHGIHHQPTQDLYSSSNNINSSHHFCSDFNQISQNSSLMAPNVPSFLSTNLHSSSPHHPIRQHIESNSNHPNSSFGVPSNPSSVPTSPISPQFPCPSLLPFSSSPSSHNLQNPINSPFQYNNRSSSSSSSSESFFPNFPTKPEPHDFIPMEDEIIKSKVYDLIMRSDLSLPINLCNEYITSSYALNQLLNQRMNELMHPYSSPLPATFEPTTVQESFIQLADYIAKSLISSIKNLSPFGHLPLQVRNDMFKGSFAHLTTIRLCFLFDLDKGGWPAPGSANRLIKYSFFKLDSQSAPYFLTFIKDLNERWQKDHKIGLILEAITLFSSNNVDMKHQEDVSKEKYIYTYLLRHYLESIGLSSDQARSDSYEMLMKLETIKMTVKPLDKIRQSCSYQPLKAGQLLSEILDLV